MILLIIIIGLDSGIGGVRNEHGNTFKEANDAECKMLKV